MKNLEVTKIIVAKEVTERNMDDTIKMVSKLKKPGFSNKEFIRVLLEDGYGADTTRDTYYGTKIDLFRLAKIAAANIKNKKFRSMLVATVQRLTSKKKCKGCANVLTNQVKPGGMKVENAKLEIKDFAWSIIINVDSTLIIEKNGKKYLMLPITDNAIEKYGHCIEIIDGQHRTLAFFYDVETLKQLCDEYFVHASVYIDGTEEEMTSVFDGLNFDASNPSASKKYNDRYVVGNLSYSERIMLKVMKRLAFSDEIIDGDGFMHESCIARNIDFGLKEGKLNSQALVQHYCCTSKKEERTNNMVQSVLDYNVINDCTNEDEVVSVIADMIQVYMESCNLVHRQMFGGDGNMFQPKNKMSINTSFAAVALSMCQACVEVMTEKDLCWTKENVSTAVYILFNDIMHASFANLKEKNADIYHKITKGGNDGYDAQFKLIQAMVDFCSTMSKEEFLQHKVVSHSRLGVRA